MISITKFLFELKSVLSSEPSEQLCLYAQNQFHYWSCLGERFGSEWKLFLWLSFCAWTLALILQISKNLCHVPENKRGSIQLNQALKKRHKKYLAICKRYMKICSREPGIFCTDKGYHVLAKILDIKTALIQPLIAWKNYAQASGKMPKESECFFILMDTASRSLPMLAKFGSSTKI